MTKYTQALSPAHTSWSFSEETTLTKGSLSSAAQSTIRDPLLQQTTAPLLRHRRSTTPLSLKSAAPHPRRQHDFLAYEVLIMRSFTMLPTLFQVSAHIAQQIFPISQEQTTVTPSTTFQQSTPSLPGIGQRHLSSLAIRKTKAPYLPLCRITSPPMTIL